MPRVVIAQSREDRLRNPGRQICWDQVISNFPAAKIIRDPRNSIPSASILCLELNGPDIQLQPTGLPAWLIIEKELDYRPSAALTIEARSNSGRVLQDAKVIAYMGKTPVYATTDEFGRVTIHTSGTPLDKLIIMPTCGCWARSVKPHASVGPVLEILCPSLPESSSGLSWWHYALGICQGAANKGRGIRVGVIDTGCGPHPSLRHVQSLGIIENGEVNDPDGRDVHFHGTHVCGIIGARPTDGSGYWGIAPECELYSARVAPVLGKTINQGDIAAAIKEMTRKDIPIINVSLESRVESILLKEAILDAKNAGCLCICAVGNKRDEVRFPARHESTVGVSAVAKLGQGPEGTAADWGIPEHPISPDFMGHDDLVSAEFACVGQQVNCCAPGIGIISTTPGPDGGGWSAWSGTSMAAPMVSATLAALLSESEEFPAVKGVQRYDYMREILYKSCVDIGLDAWRQGHGMPRMS